MLFNNFLNNLFWYYIMMFIMYNIKQVIVCLLFTYIGIDININILVACCAL